MRLIVETVAWFKIPCRIFYSFNARSSCERLRHTPTSSFHNLQMISTPLIICIRSAGDWSIGTKVNDLTKF